MNIEKSIQKLLDTVKDPLLQQTASQMKLKTVINNSGSSLELQLTAGFPTTLLEQTYKPELLSALKNQLPQMDVDVQLNQHIRAHKTQMPGKGLRGIKNTIAVASGKGGVGKSTVTVNLATALARLGARVGILDADIYGPSVPLMLGTNTPVTVKDNQYIPIQAHGVQAMSIGYLTQSDSALIWRGPMLAKSLIQMLDSTFWDDLDYLFIDLPPGTGDIQLTLVQKIPLTAAIVVTTPQNVATLDAQKALHMFDKTSIDVLGVIENMATHICSQCGHEDAIFGQGGAETLCAKHQTPLLGQLPLDSSIRQHCDQGKPTATQTALTDTFLQTAQRTAVVLASKPINYADKLPFRME